MTQQDRSSGPPQPTPQPDTQQQAQPSAGTVPAEKHGYASELLAYRVVDILAEAIANRVSRQLGTGSCLLLVSDLEQALGGMPLAEMRGQISLMERTFDERQKENQLLLEGPAELAAEVASILTAVGGVVGALPNLLALFRSDYKITERDFDVKDPALISSVAGSLAAKKGKEFKVFIPGFYYSGDSKILNDLATLSQQAARLKRQRDELALLLPKPGGQKEVKKLDEKLQDKSQKPLAKIAAAVRETDAALLSFEGFRASWTTLPQGQTQTKLEKALIRERIEALDYTHLLWLGNLSSGGETTVRESGLFGLNEIGFMGGAAVSFVLADKDGQVLDGNTYAQYGITGGKLRNYMDGNMAVHYSLVLPRQSSDES
jgi:hypothetical protein